MASTESPESEMDILLDLERDRQRLIFELKNKLVSGTALRPFRVREELRFFLQSQYGNNWLDEGTKSLKSLSDGSKNKVYLSYNERLLADGTLLFLRIDWAFENADVLDDLARKNHIKEEIRVGLLESEIDERRRVTNYVPLEDRIYSDDRIEALNRDWDQFEVGIIASRSRMHEISNFLKLLLRAQVYSPVTLEVSRFAPNIEDYWRGLGYSEIPY